MVVDRKAKKVVTNESRYDNATIGHAMISLPTVHTVSYTHLTLPTTPYV